VRAGWPEQPTRDGRGPCRQPRLWLVEQKRRRTILSCRTPASPHAIDFIKLVRWHDPRLGTNLHLSPDITGRSPTPSSPGRIKPQNHLVYAHCFHRRRGRTMAACWDSLAACWRTRVRTAAGAMTTFPWEHRTEPRRRAADEFQLAVALPRRDRRETTADVVGMTRFTREVKSPLGGRERKRAGHASASETSWDARRSVDATAESSKRKFTSGNRGEPEKGIRRGGGEGIAGGLRRCGSCRSAYRHAVLVRDVGLTRHMQAITWRRPKKSARGPIG